MTVDVVDNAEVLFRRIRFEWIVHGQGTWRLSSQAFTDKWCKPSVNRASIAPDPTATKHDQSDGVLQLVTEEVRRIDSVIRNPVAPVHAQVPYRLDVIACPILAGNPEDEPENLAHAQIESDPVLENKSRFDKVKDALARLAQSRPLVIAPTAPLA